MTSPIILILGGGGAVGSAVAQKFLKNGFKVALAYRTLKPTTDETKEFLQIKADFSDPSTIASVFAEVKEKLGVPNVVVYNGLYF
jgi:NAD(P)-dependent dehydrogenase (short-subunit alcohol dehydrogenase family)